MVKGISRQVILVQSPDPKLFEQAIFILKDEAVASGVTEEELLREARRAARGRERRTQTPAWTRGPVWACGGAAATGLVWLLSGLL